MRRVFAGTPVDPTVVDTLLGVAGRVPSAGNTQAVDWLVLDTADAVERYWSITLGERRATFTHPGLVAAPVLVVVLTTPGAYPDRYAEPDKARTGLGEGTEVWGVPYWWVDAGMAVQTLLLAVEDAGMSACFFGLFDHERAVLHAFGVPADVRALGTVALGHRAAGTEPPGRSATRPRRGDTVHRGGW